jgi:DNA-binding XRE family transcriptional regulator
MPNLSLKEYRNKYNYTQSQIGEMLDTVKQVVYKYEKGQIPSPEKLLLMLKMPHVQGININLKGEFFLITK